MHHARQRSLLAVYHLRVARHVLLNASAHEDYALLPQTARQTVAELILPPHQKRRENRVLVVPAPAFAQSVAVFHRQVQTDVALYRVDAQCRYAVHYVADVAVGNGRVEAALAVDVAVERETVILSRISHPRLDAVAGAEPVHRRHRHHHLQRACRPQQLPGVKLEQGGVGSEVVYLHPHHRCVEYRCVLEYVVYTLQHVLRPGQSVVCRCEGEFVIVVRVGFPVSVGIISIAHSHHGGVHVEGVHIDAGGLRVHCPCGA